MTIENDVKKFYQQIDPRVLVYMRDIQVMLLA